MNLLSTKKYFSHLKKTLKCSLITFIATFALLINALFPNYLKNVGEDMIEKVYLQLYVNINVVDVEVNK
jgi:hypothetical protein